MGLNVASAYDTTSTPGRGDTEKGGKYYVTRKFIIFAAYLTL
jgi:hypothetical protein